MNRMNSTRSSIVRGNSRISYGEETEESSFAQPFADNDDDDDDDDDDFDFNNNSSKFSFSNSNYSLDYQDALSTNNYDDYTDANNNNNSNNNKNNNNTDNTNISTNNNNSENEEKQSLLLFCSQFSNKLKIMEQDLSITKRKQRLAEEKTILLERRANKAEARLKLLRLQQQQQHQRQQKQFHLQEQNANSICDNMNTNANANSSNNTSTNASINTSTSNTITSSANSSSSRTASSNNSKVQSGVGLGRYHSYHRRSSSQHQQQHQQQLNNQHNNQRKDEVIDQNNREEIRPETNQNQNQQNDEEVGLSTDSFSLMMIKEPCSKAWAFSLSIFTNQVVLLSLILKDQIESSFGSTPFNVPYKVKIGVRIAQILGIFITIATSYDVVLPIKELSMFWLSNREEWGKVVPVVYSYKNGRDDGDDDSDCENKIFRHGSNDSNDVPNNSNKHLSMKVWFLHILFPNMIKFLEGLIVLTSSFVIIIQSDNVIDLCKDFAAIGLIAELDNVAFYLANLGYFGSVLKKDTEEVECIRVKDNAPVVCGCASVAIRPLVLLGLFFSIFGVFMIVVVKQINGDLFFIAFPTCDITADEIGRVGDGLCHADLNNYDCGFDDGDCLYFNLAFPDCNVPDPSRIADDICDLDCDGCRDEDGLNIYNNQDCGWDGGDCSVRNKAAKAKWPDCTVGNPGQLGDGFCHNHLNNTKCGFDDGDCTRR